MNLKFLVDTDWAIEYLRGNDQIIQKLRQIRKQGLGISIISIAELQEGVLYSKKPKESQEALKNFLSGLNILDLDEEICRIFGQERGRLRKIGRQIGDLDTLIAATSLKYELHLCTNNRRHFEVFENLNIESIA